MSRIAVIGSGPGAMYTIKYILKHATKPISAVDIFEKLRVPYGLVKFGVAPDHVEVKEVAKEFDEMIRLNQGRIRLNTSHPVEDSQKLLHLMNVYDATIVATGAQSAHRLRLPHLPKFTMSAQDFVYWYNGHPEYTSLNLPESAKDVSIVGHGNVALDVARILSKSLEELKPLHDSKLLSPSAFDWLSARQSVSGPLSVSILGRKGYLDAAFTNKEFRELTVMKDAVCRIDPSELDADLEAMKVQVKGNRTKSRGIPIIESCVENFRSNRIAKNLINLRLFTTPLEYLGDPVASLTVQRKGGSSETIPSQLGIESIGMKVSSAEQFNLPLDTATGGIRHDGRGRVIGHPKLYVAGWSKRSPRGVIAANVPCCMETADAIVEDLSRNS